MMWLIRKNPGVTPWSDDEDTAALVAGTIENWPSKDELVGILSDAGIDTVVGEHAVKLRACSSFVFRDFDGAATPSITAVHDSVHALKDMAGKVSGALAKHAIRHQFEVYDDDGKLVTSFRHG